MIRPPRACHRGALMQRTRREGSGGTPPALPNQGRPRAAGRSSRLEPRPHPSVTRRPDPAQRLAKTARRRPARPAHRRGNTSCRRELQPSQRGAKHDGRSVDSASGADDAPSHPARCGRAYDLRSGVERSPPLELLNGHLVVLQAPRPDGQHVAPLLGTHRSDRHRTLPPDNLATRCDTPCHVARTLASPLKGDCPASGVPSASRG